MRPRLPYAAAGVLATLVGLASGHLLASLLNPASSPVLAVGATVIDRTPTPVKEWAIANFGTNDKPILIGSVMAAVLLLAAVGGLLARRRLAVGAGLLVALVVVAAVLTALRPGAAATDLLPAVVTAVAAVTALWWLVSSLGSRARVRETPGGDRAAPSRRGVLVAFGVLAAAAAVLGGAGRFVTAYRRRIGNVDLPAAADPAPPFPRGLDDQVPGITPFRTSTGAFYRVDTRLDTPIVDIGGYQLTVDGDVKQSLKLSFDDLAAMPLIERDITLTCVSNSVGGEYVGGARWLGVRLTDVLDRAGVGSKADQILSTDFAGMTISTPLELATDGRDAMIAIGMNGGPLPRAHGFPVRMVVPGLYGFISATKWLTRLTLTTYAEQQAYWTDRGWATDAPIKISARIDTPRPLAQLDAGEVVVGGVAWAQQRGGVAKVEVSIDGGPWQRATLGPSAGEDYWRQWFYRWNADKGSHRISARAVAGDGEAQATVRANPFPDGASGIQTLDVSVA